MPEYALNNVKWGDATYGSSGGLIYYSITFGAGLMYDTSLYTLGNFQTAIYDAFQAWENIADIDFEPAPTPSDADIVLRFESIDGPSSVVGDATYSYFVGDPGTVIEGTIRFDTAETWTPYGETGLSFYAVAAHEIGHVLGLEHVADPTELMYPIINQADLGPGDIEGAQFLYGAVLSFLGNAFANVISQSTATDIVRILGFAGDDTLTGGPLGDRIYGGTGNDVSNGGGGDDLLQDAFGADTLNGDAGDDVIVSGADAATQNGGGDNDLLLGGIGNDILNGGSGNDVIIGDAASSRLFGNDVITGGTGNDLLEGGGGADEFVFAPGDGSDTIAAFNVNLQTPSASTIVGIDFDPAMDRVNLTAFGFTSEIQIFDAITDVGGSAVFSASGTTITFHGVSEAELLADSFIF